MDGVMTVIDFGCGTLHIGTEMTGIGDIMSACFGKVKKAAKSEMVNCYHRKQTHECYPDGFHNKIYSDRWPVVSGNVVDWHMWENKLCNSYYCPRDECCAIVTEPPFVNKTDKEKKREIFFETFETQGVVFAYPSIFSLIASGKQTGLSCTVGAGIIEISPIVDGYLIQEGIEKVDFGGHDITYAMTRFLSSCHTTEHPTQSPLDYTSLPNTPVLPLHLDDNFFLCQTAKEKLCFYPLQNNTTDKSKHLDFSGTSLHNISYCLPDGRYLTVGEERVSIPSLMFKPWMYPTCREKETFPGLAGVIVRSIMKCPIDVRKQLLKNIVVSGGETLYPGFKEHLVFSIQQQLKKHVDPFAYKLQKRGSQVLSEKQGTHFAELPQEINHHITSFVENETNRRICTNVEVEVGQDQCQTWRGGRMFATVVQPTSFLWKGDYEEEGPSSKKGLLF